LTLGLPVLPDAVGAALSWLNWILSVFAVSRTTWCFCTMPCVPSSNSEAQELGTIEIWYLVVQVAQTVLCRSASDCWWSGVTCVALPGQTQ